MKHNRRHRTPNDRWILTDGLILTYNGVTYLTSVTNTFGRSLTLAYSGAHLASVTDDTGRSATYGYGGANLVAFTDPLSFQTVFTYDTASHLTQVFYPSHPTNAFVTNSYDALGRVGAQANANGNGTSFYFAGSRTETVDPAGDRHVTYQTPRGKVVKARHVAVVEAPQVRVGDENVHCVRTLHERGPVEPYAVR